MGYVAYKDHFLSLTHYARFTWVLEMSNEINGLGDVTYIDEGEFGFYWVWLFENNW